MLISPPFLLPRQANESEDAWLDRCMPGGLPGDGAFPLSFNLGWHGGVHLQAPTANGQSEAVRAIADGVVVFVREPSPQGDASHPLNYRGWTDNGCVVVRHDTEVGHGTSASVSFFSITMHLSMVDPSVKVGRSVWRKSPIGIAGQIDGALERKIHLEVVCDDANLVRLVGRSSGDLITSADGRLDAVYGQVYFCLPAGTQFYAQKPLDHLSAAHIQPPNTGRNGAMPPVQSLPPVYISAADEELIVGLRYACGDGPSGHRGSAFLTTLRPDGTQIGDALEEFDAEYNLYARASEISHAYSANAQPAPSAVYELLRFGRVVNNANETLIPNDVPHWRRVRYAGGQGWVNLNAAGVRKFSDADFPQWQQWCLIDDSSDKDSRCDSTVLRRWLDVDGDGKIDLVEATTRLTDASLSSRLAHVICKFPTEWDGATVEQRWGWLRSRSDENPRPFTESDFSRLRAHIQSLALSPSSMGLPVSHWHIHPREFIRHFRRCGWLSERELLRCLPLVYQANRGNRNTPIVQNTLLTFAARARLGERDRSTFLRVIRKYGLTRQRLCHFLAQIFQETGVLRWAQELASGAEYQGRADLGNTQPGDGVRFKGRGLIQTTGRINYANYSLYHGRISGESFTVEPNNGLLASSQYYSADTAGLYWASRSVGGRRICISRIADEGVNEAQIRLVTKNVNGAEDGLWTGLVARRSHTLVTSFILLDSIAQPTPERIRTDV